MNEPERQIMSILGEAVEYRLPQERDAFLDKACADDPERRARLEALLRAYEAAGNFLQGGCSTREPQATADQVVAQTPGTVIGPYKLLEQIGEGGFGVVFMAEQTGSMRRKVALKVLKPGMDTRQVVARFAAERQALAIMDHPNIAKVFDAGATPSGRPYFVMELVKGVPITDFCDRNHLTPRQRLELFIPVCQAVQHAHQKGVIHRDLKPSNVLVTVHDTTPVPKIIDFGIAKALGSACGGLTDQTLFTGFAQMIGTPLYMSPEQAGQSGLDIDTRSDIYSLGVLLYELLTGTTPFDAERFKQAAYDEIRRIIRDEDPPKPSTRLSELGSPTDRCAEPAGSVTRNVPTALVCVAAHRQTEPAKLTKLVRGELDWIVMKALEKDRNRRYETANGFSQDLQRYLHDEPVLACPPSARYRLRKFARRHKRTLVTATLLGVILLAAVGAVAGTVGWAMRDRDARNAAIEREADLTLAEGKRLLGQGKYAEALSAAKRADSLLSDGAGENLRECVRDLHRDLTMVERLEEIRLPRAVGGAEGAYDNAGADIAYAAAFREYGIDVDALEPAAAAELICAKTIRLELTVALDTWARKRKSHGKADELRWKRLIAVARAADPDEWRNQVRDAVDQGHMETLATLAGSPKVGTLPLQTLSLLGQTIPDAGVGEALLRQAQQRYPDDFWINFQLAWSLEHLQPPKSEDAIRFYAVAKALRPRNAPVHVFLGNALQRRGQLDDAMVEYRRAIEMQPNYAVAHNNLGAALSKKGSLDDAIAEHQEAIRLVPVFPQAHLQLAWIYNKRSQWEQAIVHCSRVIELKGDERLAREFRARAYLNTGQWGPAADDLASGLSSGPVNDAWTRVACLRLLASDSKGYQELCRQLAQGIAAEESRASAYFASRVCALSPDSPIAASQAVRWAELNVAAGKNAWNLHALGLAHYRAGQFERAIQRCEESLKVRADWQGNMLNWLVLAMAHQRLGQSQEAAPWLDKAVAWRDQLPQRKDKTGALPAGLAVQDWLEFEVLFGEAKPFVTGKSP